MTTAAEVQRLDSKQSEDGEVDNEELREQIRVLADGSDRRDKSLQERLVSLEDLVQLMHLAMAGQMELALEPVESDITAAELNAGAAGTVTRQFEVTLEVPLSNRHVWLTGIPLGTVVPTVTATNKPPITDGAATSQKAIEGRWLITYVFDTDAGATKTWVAGDQIDILIPISNETAVANKWKFLGFDIPEIIKIFHVI